jgi:two-component system invasion response regulator UvrY
VSAGGVYFSAKVAELLVSEATPHAESLPHQRLSDREFQIFEHIVRGMSMTDIANELSLSIKTVSTHKSHIMAKMGMSTQVELVRYAIAHHLMSD